MPHLLGEGRVPGASIGLSPPGGLPGILPRHDAEIFRAGAARVYAGPFLRSLRFGASVAWRASIVPRAVATALRSGSSVPANERSAAIAAWMLLAIAVVTGLAWWDEQREAQAALL